MSSKTYPVSASWKKRAFVDDAGYKAMYAESMKTPSKFWAKHAKRLDWFKAPTKIKNVDPVYPPIAQSARKEGVVIIELLVGIDGHVKEAKVIRSVPLLDQAALDAVKQWVYTPTLLNNVPQEIYYNITVSFTLK